MTNFNIAYEKWLQIYQAERNFKLNYDLLAHDLEALAKQLNLKFTPKDKQNVLNASTLKGFYNKIYKNATNKELYENTVKRWYEFENSRRNELFNLLDVAKAELFQYIGTIPYESFQGQNLSLFCTYDISPNNQNLVGIQAIYNRLLGQLYAHKFDVKLCQATWHYGDKWNPVVVNAVYANVNDRLKYAMCYPSKEWERLEVTQENLKIAFYRPIDFGYQSYLFEPDFVPTELMQDFKVSEL